MNTAAENLAAAILVQSNAGTTVWRNRRRPHNCSIFLALVLFAVVAAKKGGARKILAHIAKFKYTTACLL